MTGNNCALKVFVNSSHDRVFTNALPHIAGLKDMSAFFNSFITKVMFVSRNAMSHYALSRQG